ncbi:protein-disulfide reductase DsbD domain-containing protein [Sulfitobacter aestuarii]|uniref:Protein-disulfide reductase DsbD domain-containing protein n=1 Tax=Sulfitobacter aestuarii TaxID=2161676 RepID=A0ABW5U494_9RHOB
MLISRLTALCLLCLTPLSAGAQNLPAPLRAEILPGWQQPDGSRIAGLKLSLAPGWKTYWRAPGDAGIPPRFDWSGSVNLQGIEVSYPTPIVFRQSGMRSIGYQDQVILPLTIRPRDADAPVILQADIELGVCLDICMPETLSLSARLDDPGAAPTPAIAAALAQRPYSAAEANVQAARCAINPGKDGLEIEARLVLPSTGREEVVVIEPGRPDLWMSETDVTRQGEQLTARGDLIARGGGALALDRSAIRITVLGSQRSVEIIGCAPA